MKDTKMELTIRYNRSSVHIQGIPEATTGPVTDTSSKTGVVSYYAQSACGGLTRSGHRMAVSDTYDNAADALMGATLKAKSLGLKLCKNCEKAAKWAIASVPADTESEEFQAEKARVDAQLEASNQRYKEAEAARKAEAEAPGVYDHAAAVAQMRANIDAEEEERAAARRARNRTNYAPAPAPAIREAEPESQEEMPEETPDVEAMREEYDDLVLTARGLRLLADELCRKLAEMTNSGMEKDHPRFKKAHAKLVRTLDLESANLRTRVALADKIRETRVRNAYGVEKPFHRMVEDAINLKW